MSCQLSGNLKCAINTIIIPQNKTNLLKTSGHHSSSSILIGNWTKSRDQIYNAVRSCRLLVASECCYTCPQQVETVLLLTNPTVSLYLSPLLTLDFVAICLSDMSMSFPMLHDVLITAAVNVGFSDRRLCQMPYLCPEVLDKGTKRPERQG